MRQIRHSLWRTLSVVALLIITQLAFAGQLCLARANGMANRSMHSMPDASHAAGMQEADGDCCSAIAPQNMTCAAALSHAASVRFTGISSIDPPSAALLAAAPQVVTPRSHNAAFPIVAAGPPVPLRDLYCRYVI